MPPENAQESEVSTEEVEEVGAGEDSPENIAEVFNFDPFDVDGQVSNDPAQPEGVVEPTQPEQPASTGANSTDGAPPGGQPVMPEGTPSIQTEGAQADEISGLRQQVSQMQGMLQAFRMQGQGGQPQPSQGQAPQQAQGQPQPQYRFRVPDEAMVGLRSENDSEYRGVIENLLNGVAQNIHTNLTQEFRAHVAQTVPSMIQTSQQTRGQQEAVYNDFYASFPDLNNPGVKGIVLGVAQQMAREGHVQWNDGFRNALGHRVRATLQQYAPEQARANAQPAAQPTPQALRGSGAHQRQTRNSLDDNSPEAIARDLFGG